MSTAPSQPEQLVEVSTNTPAPKKTNRKRGKNMKSIAEASINANAKPIPLSKYFGGFEAIEHGNAYVELDDEVPERYSTSLIQLFRNDRQAADHLFMPGVPEQLRNTTDMQMRSVSCGLNFAMASKLVSAAPHSKLAELADFLPVSAYGVEIPTSFNEILDLMGKTDVGDDTIRVKHHVRLVKTLYLKGLWHFSRTEGFDSAIYDPLVKQALRRLKTMTAADLRNMVYQDFDSVDLIMKTGRKQLEIELMKTFPITLNDVEYRISPPYLRRNANAAQVIEWFQSLPPQVNKVELVRTALMTLVTSDWLTNYDKTLHEVEPVLDPLGLGSYTILALLNNIGLNLIDDIFDSDDLFTLSITMVMSQYSRITSLLRKTLRMSETNRTSFGKAAQLITIPKKDLLSFDRSKHHELLPGLEVVKPNARTMLCSRKLAAPDASLIAAAFRITKNVEFIQGYESVNRIHFSEVIRQVVSRSDRAPSD